MARRVFLHVGPPKTGTSFLQSVWWHNRDVMAEHGLLYPGTHLMAHFQAAAVVCGIDRITQRMSPAQMRSWDELTAQIAAHDGDALLSSERFSNGGFPEADRALRRLEEVADEVHVLVTARDLVRQVPSSWQQHVKRGGEQTLEEWWRELATDPGHSFWTYHDVADVLRRWSQGLPPERMHLIVHARPGAPSGLLLDRACAVIGIDPAILSPVGRGNESLGSTHVELLRRINTHLPAGRDRLDMGRLTKAFFTRTMLIPAGDSDSFVMPEAMHEWAVERGQAMVEELRGCGYDVVGDLEDLLPDPVPPAGRTHVEVSDAELADLASSVLARMLVHELETRQERDRLRHTVRRLRRRLRRSQPGRPVARPAGAGRRLLRRLRAVTPRS